MKSYIRKYVMTGRLSAATHRAVGRKKLYPVRLTLPITADMLARLDATRGVQERVTVIRAAVERELKRRETAAKPTKPRKSRA
jgi:hypothetical protein